MKIKTLGLTAAMMAMMVVPAMAADTVTTSTTGVTDQNVQVNVQINPTITMALSTNEINFVNADPTTNSYEQAAALKITVQSNNTYKVTVKAVDDFKTSGETPLVMTVNHLEVKAQGDQGSAYQAMSKDAPVVLVDNQPNTASTAYDIDFKLNSDWQVKPGNYSTTLNFVASQI